jgi:hypothetical protein
MFNQTPPEKTKLEEAIDDLLREMSGSSADSQEYENLLGIGMIIGHERTGVVTSKALGFIKKLW